MEENHQSIDHCRGKTQSAIDGIEVMKIGESKDQPVNDDTVMEFKKLKEDANILFQAKKYTEAIDVYDLALIISGLSNDDQALIYSNKSAAYFSLKTKDSFAMAKSNAELAINFRPSWWRGYFRLGRAEEALGNLHEAKQAFETAVALNHESKECRDELSSITVKLITRERNDSFDPSFLPGSFEKQFEDAYKRSGLTGKEFISKFGKNFDTLEGYKWQMGFYGRQDFAKALGFYAKAAESGDSCAMFNLGNMYRMGQGVKRDFDEAFKWYIKAATTKKLAVPGDGIASAQQVLGNMYQKGEGVKRDFEKAFEWYVEAVNNGSAGASNNLGMMYMDGQFVESSPKVAFQYFKFASEGGVTEAMRNLAECYFAGRGTPSGIPNPQDKNEGQLWLQKAKEKGDLRVVQRLEEVEKMSYMECFNSAVDSGNRKGDPLDQELYREKIEEAAKNGSLIAQRQLEIWGYLNAAIEAFKQSNSTELVLVLSKAIRLHHQIIKIPEFLTSPIQERLKIYPNDLDALTCCIKLIALKGDGQSLLKLVEEKLPIYPQDEYLLDMKATALLNLRQLKAALQTSSHALKVIFLVSNIRFSHSFLEAIITNASKIAWNRPQPPRGIYFFCSVFDVSHLFK